MIVNPQPLSERSAFVTEPGRRPINQDSVLLEVLPGGDELVIVADGMGGHAGGEVASRQALEVVRSSLIAGHDFESAVQMANVAIYQEANAKPDYYGMGTTLVGLLRRGGQYVVLNVGDSRAYRIDATGIRQLTEDHSFLAEAIRSGQYSSDEAENSPWRNAITRSVGTEPDLQVDRFGPFDANEAHAVLLCSDGVYRTLSDEDLRTLVLSVPQLDEAARAVAGAAYETGSDDNISVALVRFGPQ